MTTRDKARFSFFSHEREGSALDIFSANPRHSLASRASSESSVNTIDALSSLNLRRHKKPRSRPSLNHISTTNSLPSSSDSSSNPTHELLKLNRHILAQTQQARRLFDQKAPHLDDPTEREWIHATITDTEDATRDVAMLLESSRVEQETNSGRMGFKSRVRWVLWDAQRAKDRRDRLLLCHRSLMPVMTRLQQVETPAVGVGSQRIGLERAQYSESVAGSSKATTTGTPDGFETDTGHEAYVSSSPKWDLSVHLQDPGMELVVPTAITPLPPPIRPFLTQSARSSTVKLAPQESPPPTELDHELLDMLSWRWNQGQPVKPEKNEPQQ